MPGKACNPTSTWRNTTISFLSEIRKDAADEVQLKICKMWSKAIKSIREILTKSL